MNDILERIFAAKALIRERDERSEPYDAIRVRALMRKSERRPFAQRLRTARGPALVAEIKRASPSVGLIARNFDPGTIAQAYDAAGVEAISVLTETDHFLGELAYLDIVRAAAKCPLLRKDFLSTPYEVAQSGAYGADAILLIVAGVTDDALERCMAESRDYDLDVLVEVHNAQELERALKLGVTLIGINNRNLRTFETDLAVSEHLIPLVPPGITIISESGMREAPDIGRLFAAGAHGFLIGEALMRAENPAGRIRELKEALAGSAAL